MRQALWLMNFVFWLIDWLMESEKIFFVSSLQKCFHSLLEMDIGIWVASLCQSTSFFIYFPLICFPLFSVMFCILVSTSHFDSVFAVKLTNLQGRIIKLAIIYVYILYIVMVINISFILFIPCFLCKTWNTVDILFKKPDLKLKCSGNLQEENRGHSLVLSQTHSSQSIYAKASPDTYGLYGFVSLPLPRPLPVLFKSRIELGFSALKWCGKSTNCKYLPSVKNRQQLSCQVLCCYAVLL